MKDKCERQSKEGSVQWREETELGRGHTWANSDNTKVKRCMKNRLKISTKAFLGFTFEWHGQAHEHRLWEF